MHTLTIAALSTPHTISLAALQACKEADRLFVQTAQTPCIAPISHLRYEVMDDLYAHAEDFDSLQQAILQRLLAALLESNVVYAVPGGLQETHTMFSQRARAYGHRAILLPGVSFAQAACAQAADCHTIAVVAPASALPARLDPALALAIEEMDTVLRAGEVKLVLQEYFPDEHPVQFCSMAQDGAYGIKTIPLYELDRQKSYHATSVLLVPPVGMLNLSRFGFYELEQVMHQLRAPGGCPWDGEQTHESLKKTMIEECYEVLDAIDKQDDAALCEELGDVLLQCVFHAEIAEEQGRFNGRDISTGIVKKLIYRHPHIFAAGKADTADDVIVKWEQLKKTEKQFQTQTEVLLAVPRNLPALMRAYKVQKKAAQVGFDWASAEEALPKLREETDELSAAMLSSEGNVAEEMGDTLFAAVNVCRLLKLDPEEILTKASDKFIGRFEKIEKFSHKNGRELQQLSLQEQDMLWNAIKSAENGQK